MSIDMVKEAELAAGEEDAQGSGEDATVDDEVVEEDSSVVLESEDDSEEAADEEAEAAEAAAAETAVVDLKKVDPEKEAKKDAKKEAKKAAKKAARKAAAAEAAASEVEDAGDDAEGDTEVAAADDSEEEARPGRFSKLRRRPKVSLQWVAAVLAGAAIGGAVFGYIQYNRLNHELTTMRQTQSDRETAARLAKEYALKSLTYTFEDPDAFFRSVESGVSQSLKDKYVNATNILKGVMVQAQVTSSGEVLAVDAAPQPGDVYQVVVSAAQTTRNLQNPKPRVSLILLQVTVNKTKDGWQVSDIGPKTGSHAGMADQMAPPAPAPESGPPAPPVPPAPRR